jgi:hypothetical protein
MDGSIDQHVSSERLTRSEQRLVDLRMVLMVLLEMQARAAAGGRDVPTAIN